MKNRIEGCLCLGLVILSVLLTGCPVTPTPATSSGTGGEDIAEVGELFVDGGGPGEVVFLTNDTAWWSPLGYTLWALNGTSADPFSEREVKCNKVSGSDVAGYGIVLCHYDSGDPDTGETMLVVLINASAEYIVGEVVDDEFFPFFPWTDSDNLLDGYNKGNRIRVVWDNSESNYQLYLNDVLETTFLDEEPPLHQSGANGYLVVISPEDSFPQESVHVIFTEL